VSFSTQEPAEFTPASQTPVLNAVVAQHPKGIIISPNDAKAMYPPIMQAKEAGIPVVSALNTLDDAAPLASQSISDETAGGRAAADEIAKLAGGRHVDVAVITYKPGASIPADTRWHSFESEIKKYPNIHYIGPQFMNDLDPSSATQLADGLLSRDPNLFAIDGTFGFAGQGAATAVHQRGAKTQVVTYDSDAGSINDLKQGLVKAVIDYDQPAVGAFAMQQVFNAANGKPVQKLYEHKPIVYTRANMNDPQLRGTLDTTACSSSGRS
jgi:ribose transport system substrate-binding protein